MVGLNITVLRTLNKFVGTLCYKYCGAPHLGSTQWTIMLLIFWVLPAWRPAGVPCHFA